MTETLHRLADNKNNGGQIPFALMATAYRRKKLLGDVLENTAESLGNVVQAGFDEKEREEEREVLRQKEREDAGACRALLLHGVLSVEYLHTSSETISETTSEISDTSIVRQFALLFP